MSKSALVNKNFGSIRLETPISAVSVNTFTGGSLTLSQLQSGDTYIIRGTSGTITIPNSKVVSYDFIAGVNGACASLVSAGTNNVYGLVVCNVTGANFVISGSDSVSFTTGSLIGDHVNVTSDGAKLYVNGHGKLATSFVLA